MKNKYYEELKKEIESVNDYTDQRKVAELRRKLDWVNVADEEGRELVRIARHKI